MFLFQDDVERLQKALKRKEKRKEKTHTKWNERTQEGKRREQMAQANLKIVSKKPHQQYSTYWRGLQIRTASIRFRRFVD